MFLGCATILLGSFMGLERPKYFSKLLEEIQHLERTSYKFSNRNSKYPGLGKIQKESIGREISGATLANLDLYRLGMF